MLATRVTKPEAFQGVRRTGVSASLAFHLYCPRDCTSSLRSDELTYSVDLAASRNVLHKQSTASFLALLLVYPTAAVFSLDAPLRRRIVLICSCRPGGLLLRRLQAHSDCTFQDGCLGACTTNRAKSLVATWQPQCPIRKCSSGHAYIVSDLQCRTRRCYASTQTQDVRLRWHELIFTPC